MTVAYVVVIS